MNRFFTTTNQIFLNESHNSQFFGIDSALVASLGSLGTAILPTFIDPIWHSVRDDLLSHEARVADRVDAPAGTPTDEEGARHVGHEVDGVVLDEGDPGRLVSCCSVSSRCGYCKIRKAALQQ